MNHAPTPTLTRWLRGATIAASLLHLPPLAATELVYSPVNPTFGGNPMNASGLLNNANAQNDYKAPVNTPTPKTPLERFTSQVQSAILNRLSGNVVSAVFAEDGKIIEDKTITAGNYQIAISRDANGNLVMSTLDKTSGASTQVIVGNVSDNLENQ